MIDGFVCKVISSSSSSSISSSHCVLADCVGYCNPWIHVSFCCNYLGHKSWFHSLLRFSILPTGANPIHNFVCRLAFPCDQFRLAYVIADHAMLCSCSIGKGCMLSCQYGTDSFFRRYGRKECLYQNMLIPLRSLRLVLVNL